MLATDALERDVIDPSPTTVTAVLTRSARRPD
jgi:hypothetical protein